MKLEGCSEACPARVALLAVGLRQKKVAQRNHRDYFILLCCIPLFSAIRKQVSFFPNVTARAEQKIAT